MTTKELKSYIDRILGNNVRCLLPSYWWKRMFGMTLDKMDADKEELIKKIQSAGSKVTVDSALSTTSTNPVQNKVVTEAINERPTALQMLEFVGNTYEDVNRSVYIGNTEDYHIVNWKETNKTNLTRNVSENEIIHFRIKYILDKYNFITLNPVSIERFPSTTADYATYYECVVCINDAYERWRIYVDGSVEFVGLENIGEASGALQFGQERMVYFETSNTPAKLTDEQKAYNAETYKMVCIDDKPVYLSHFGHWGYQKELTFGDPNGHMIVGFLMGSKDSLQEASVRINADGSAYLIGLVNIADATLDAESERPIQNKAVTLALNEKASIAYVNEKVGNAGGNITVDTEFSETSENPIANKTVAKALSEVADAFEGKQNTIADLDEIRSGAAKGATAIQEVKTINNQSILGEGNITIQGGGGGATLENVEFVNIYLPDGLAQIMANEDAFSAEIAEMLVGTLAEYGEAETSAKAQSAYAEMFQKNIDAYNKIQENISKQKDTIVVVNSSLTISAYNDSPLFSEFVGGSYYGTEFTALGVIEWNNVIGEANGIPFYIRFNQNFESKRIYLDEQGCIHYEDEYRLLHFPLVDGVLSEEQNESNARVLKSLFAKVLKPTDVRIRGVDTLSRECILVDSYLDMLSNQCVVHCFTETGIFYKATISLNEDGTSSASGTKMFNA